MVRPERRWNAARLGATDMKGPVAAAILAARALPQSVPVSLFITTDEEMTKEGARELVQRSMLRGREACDDPGRRADETDSGARPSQPYPFHLRRNRRAGA